MLKIEKHQSSNRSAVNGDAVSQFADSFMRYRVERGLGGLHEDKIEPLVDADVVDRIINIHHTMVLCDKNSKSYESDVELMTSSFRYFDDLGRYATILVNIGDIFYLQNQYDMAVKYYEHALKSPCFNDSDVVHPVQVNVLDRLGSINKTLSQYNIALQCYERCMEYLALDIFDHGGYLRGSIAENLQSIHEVMGDSNSSLTPYDKLPPIPRYLSYNLYEFPHRFAKSMKGNCSFGSIYQAKLQYDEDVLNYGNSLKILKAMGVHKHTLITEKVLAIVSNTAVSTKDVVLNLLQSAIKQNSSPSNELQSKDFSILELFVAPVLPFDINVEDVKQCFSEIKDDLEQLNGWLSMTSEDSSIHVIIADIVLKSIKRQQLQKQQHDAYFISSSVELKKQLKKAVSPNHLETYKKQAMEHVLLLAKRGERVDNLITLLKACLEPAMFLNSYRPSWFFGQTRENFLIARLGAKIKELNWAITQHQRSLEYGDICTDLAAIRDIYISYKEQLSNVYNSKPSDEREQKLKLMCEPRYMMLGAFSSRDYLCEEARMHLTPADGETEVTQTENKFGTHIVRQYGGIHFKYHMETVPCYPAVEYMVGGLYNMLAGASYGIAPTEIVKLYRPGCIDKPEHAQVLVASQSVEGVNLFDFLLRHAQHHPEYLQKIDLYSFSAMVITSLLSNPANGKADDYMVSFIPHENHEDDDFKVKIVGIDNDLSFASPIIKKHTGRRAGQHFVEVQSIFYFFPQMRVKIHPKLCGYLINQSVEILLINFIKALQTQNHKYEKLKEDGLLTESEWKALGLPVCFTVNDSLVFIYNKLIEIQSCLSKNRNSSHATLFESLYPEMFAYYQQISSSENTEATAILDKFCKLASSAAPSLEDAGIIIDHGLTRKIALKAAGDGDYLDRTCALSEVTEAFVKAIDFAKISSIDLQRRILDSLKELNCLEQLTLRNCSALDDSLLVTLAISLSKLKSIHIIGCPNITVDGVLTTYDTYMHAKKLSFGLSRCAKITAREYQQMADMQIPLELLAKDSQSKYYGFTWSGNANTILHQILSQSLNLSLSIEQMRFLIAKGLDINSHNDGQTPLNGYTALHIAAVNRNLKMLGLLLALWADPQKLDKYSQETPFQKAAKRKLFMPCYALSQANNTILSKKERQNLSDLSVREIQSAYRGYRARNNKHLSLAKTKKTSPGQQFIEHSKYNDTLSSPRRYVQETISLQPIIGERHEIKINYELKNYLDLNNLEYVSMAGDGHCLYNAVSLYLGTNVSTLRNMVADHIQANRDELEPQLLSLLAPLGITVDDYIEKIRKQEWADNLEIAALEMVYHRPIIIVGPDGKHRNISNIDGEPIYVLYNGHNHYDGLIKTQMKARSKQLHTVTDDEEDTLLLIAVNESLLQYEKEHGPFETNAEREEVVESFRKQWIEEIKAKNSLHGHIEVGVEQPPLLGNITESLIFTKNQQLAYSFGNVNTEIDESNSVKNLREYQNNSKSDPELCQVMERVVMESLGYRPVGQIEAGSVNMKLSWQKEVAVGELDKNYVIEKVTLLVNLGFVKDISTARIEELYEQYLQIIGKEPKVTQVFQGQGHRIGNTGGF